MQVGFRRSHAVVVPDGDRARRRTDGDAGAARTAGRRGRPSHGAHDAALAAFAGSLWTGLLAVTVHTLAMLLAAGAIAWLVFAWVGLAVLRRAWINLDLIWSAALIATGAVFLVLAGLDFASMDGPSWRAPSRATIERPHAAKAAHLTRGGGSAMRWAARR